MSLPVEITLANPDPSANPLTYQEHIDILRTLFAAEVTGDYLPYVTGSATPGSDDQDKVWHKEDGSGRPLGTFMYYGGAWRRQYTGLPSEHKYFTGNPATYFDGTGKGIVSGDWDGWALCNGQNGTEDLSEKFVVAGGVYTGGVWTSDVDGVAKHTGGAKDHLIIEQNLPGLKVELAGNAYDGATNLSDFKPIIDDDYRQDITQTVSLADYGATTGTQSKILTLPPFVAMAICKFIGYT